MACMLSPRQDLPVHVRQPDRLGLLADAIRNCLRRALIGIEGHTLAIRSLVQVARKTAILIPDKII